MLNICDVQHDYFYNPKGVESSYMSCTFESTDLAKDHLKAAIHPADGSIRPQIVKKEVNIEYYDLNELVKADSN